MTPRSLDHVSITVSDVGRSLTFYRDLLEIPVLGQGEEEGPPLSAEPGAPRSRFRFADMDLGGGQILELLQFVQPQGKNAGQTVFDPGSGHVGLRVTQLDAVLQRLRAAGYPPRFEPLSFESPAWWAGARVVYVSDPDGATVELVERSPR